MVGLNVRFPEDLFKALKELAAKDKRSLNSEILFILEEYIKKRWEEIKEKPKI